MEKREIHELSYDELVLYEKQLIEELGKVRAQKNQYRKAVHTGLLNKNSSPTSSEEQ